MGSRNSQFHNNQNIHPVLSTTTETKLSTGKTSQQVTFSNILIVWIDATIDERQADSKNTLNLLHRESTDVTTFTDIEACMKFLRDKRQEKILLITSGSLGRTIIPLVHRMPQIDTIYIFCGNREYHQEWMKQWNKIQDVYENIEPICEAIHLIVKQFNENSILLSFTCSDGLVHDNSDPNQLEPSFMYTKLLKKIFFDMEQDETARDHLVIYYREKFMIHPDTLTMLEEFQKDYQATQAIYWYTRESFLYQMLNRALRSFEVDMILNMSFFIRDLLDQIKVLHQTQLPQYHNKPFILYRDQLLSMLDFDKLQKHQGGLIAFNGFLSTSKKRSLSLSHVEIEAKKMDMIGIVFVMHIDPTIRSTPFVDLQGLSYFPREKEVLFSMHSVFHIGKITLLNESSRLFEVSLTLTSDTDQQLNLLTEQMTEEMNGITGWKRFGHLLIKMGLLDKAEDLHRILLGQSLSTEDEAYYYHQLGVIKDQQAKYPEAIHFYEQSLKIKMKILSPVDPSFAVSYNNLGAVYDNMGDYSKALYYYKKTLEIEEKILSPTDRNIAISYNNLGAVYDNMENYEDALYYYDKALSIYKETLSPNHPSLATAYNNVGGAYYGMQVLAKALSYYLMALEIRQKALPSNHSDIAHTYNDIGLVYDNLGDYCKALSHYACALDIQENSLPADHLHLAITYNNIGGAYYELRQYRKALFYFKKTVDIRQKTYPRSHPDVQDSFKWIEMTKQKLSIASINASQDDEKDENDSSFLRG